MKGLFFIKSLLLIMLFVNFSSIELKSQACKVRFCSCCEEEGREYQVYTLYDVPVGTSAFTEKGGCTDSAGFSFPSGGHYYIQEVNPLCDNVLRVYFTACPCGTDVTTINVPCCLDDRINLDEKDEKGQSSNFKLYQNFPNPFNPATKIDFRLLETSSVKITVYDVNGKVVEELLNAVVPEGNHSVIWNADKLNLSSGIYFYKLEAGDFTDEKKMVLIK